MFQVRDSWCRRWRLSTVLTWRFSGGSMLPFFSCYKRFSKWKNYVRRMLTQSKIWL
jgi:hypothetical protein